MQVSKSMHSRSDDKKANCFQLSGKISITRDLPQHFFVPLIGGPLATHTKVSTDTFAQYLCPQVCVVLVSELTQIQGGTS